MAYHYRANDAKPGPDRRRAASIQTSRITVHPVNIRRDLGDLTELSESIKRHGIMVPLILERRGETYRVRDGHRRLAAAELAGLRTVPAIIHEQALREPDWHLQAVEVNSHRQGLDRAERAANIHRLREQGWTNEDIGHAYGVSAGTISKWANYDPDHQPIRRPARELTYVPKKHLRALADEWADRLPAEFLAALRGLTDPAQP